MPAEVNDFYHIDLLDLVDPIGHIVRRVVIPFVAAVKNCILILTVVGSRINSVEEHIVI